MKQYVVDAFADKLFQGNPAAICVMDKWLADELMQAIAKENNLSETAFTVKEGDSYKLRWFTPGGEIDLCGHATLATAFVLMNYVDASMKKVAFQTLSGQLIVERKGELYELDFPVYEMEKLDVTEEIKKAVGVTPLEAWMGRDMVCILKNEADVKDLQPDIDKVMELEGLLLHVTSKGSEYDCVSRTFAPKLDVIEDPVCGSGHCHIAPLWAAKLGKTKLKGRQASERGGTLYCEVMGDRVKLAGKAVLYSISELFLGE